MTTTDTRRAALTLHALPLADREWVLRRLDPRQQTLVLGHLRELASLAIPADPGLIDIALRQSALPPRHAALRSELNARSAEQIRDCLRGEPASLVARLLLLGPWAWEDCFLQLLAPQVRARVQACRQRPVGAGHDLDEWLIDELATRIKASALLEPTFTDRPLHTDAHLEFEEMRASR